MSWKAKRVEVVPGVCGSQPVIRDTRIRVTDVVQWLDRYDRGYLTENFPELTFDDIDAALGYYAEHRVKLNEYIQEDEEAERRLSKGGP